MSIKDFVPNMPSFVKQLQDVEVAGNGKAVSLMCTIQGNPKPEVQWLHNGKALTEIENQIVMTNQGEDEFRLDIRNFDAAKHVGTYTAVAKNIYGDVHSSAIVEMPRAVETAGKDESKALKRRLIKKKTTEESIESKDKSKEEKLADFKEPNIKTFIMAGLCDQTVLAGETAIMKCTMQPTLNAPQIEWLKDGRQIKATSRFAAKYESQSGKASLSITVTRAEDAGTYTVGF